MADFFIVLSNGIAAGAVVALVALGFGLIHRASSFFHLSHGAFITLGGYTAYAAVHYWGLNIFAAGLLAATVSAIGGLLVNHFVFSALKARDATDMTLLLASMGVYIILQNCLASLFGNQNLLLRTQAIQRPVELAWGATILPTQVFNILVGLSVCCLIDCLLRYSSFGKDFRAAADNPSLARIVGINTLWISNAAFALGSALAGVSAVAMAYDAELNPSIGLRALLPGTAAYIIGGTRKLAGAIPASLAIGILLNFAGWWLPNRWQDSIVYVVLLIGPLVKALLRREG